MITAKEAAEAMQTATDVLNGITPDQWDTALERMAADRLRVASDHAANLARAKAEQDRMNAENAAYIKREWDKNHPPNDDGPRLFSAVGSLYASGFFPQQTTAERIMPWRLSRDDLAELRLWWDWKQLDGDVKLEMPPPPCPSEMTQAFMDTNPAWKFRQDGTLVASSVSDAFLSATENGSNIASLVWAVSLSIVFLLGTLIAVDVLTHVIHV